MSSSSFFIYYTTFKGISHFVLYYLDANTTDGHPPYIIGEAKYGSSRLSILADGTPQMSDKWIIDRLENAVGEEIANDIKMEMILNPDNVGSTLVHVSSDGGIDITELIDGIKQ